MPDSLLTRFPHRRAWMAWALVFVLTLAQPAWEYSLALAAPSLRQPASSGWLARGSALPDWFTLARAGEVTATTKALATPQAASVASVPLPHWFSSASRISPLYQTSPSLSKHASVVTATIDQIFTYTLVFTIPSGNTLTDVRIEDFLPNASSDDEPRIYIYGTEGNYGGPSPLTLDTPSINPGDVSFCGSGNYYLCWDLPDVLNPSAQPYVYQMTYQAEVQSRNTDRGDVGTNQATLSWDGGSVTAGIDVTIAAPNLSVKRIAYTADGERAERPGSDDDLLDLRADEIITITVLVTNVADSFVSPAYELEIIDQWPAWIGYMDTLAGPAPDGIEDDQVSWAESILGAGETFFASYRVAVTSTVAPDLRSRANTTVDYRYLPGGNSSPGASAGRVTFRSPDIDVVKTVEDEAPEQGRVVVGEVVTYTIVYTLPGGTTVYDPTYLEDQLDDGLRFMGVVTQPTEVVGFNVDETGDNDTILTWDVTTPLNPATDLRHTYVFTAQASPTYFLGSDAGDVILKGTSLRNRARLNWDRGPWAGNTSSSWSENVEVVLIRPQIIPQKSKDGAPNAIAGAGIPVRFELSDIRNGDGLGDADADVAYSVRVTDTLPEGWTYEGSVPSGITGTINGRTVITWGVTPILTVGWYLPGPSIATSSYVVTATSPATVVVGALFTNTVEVSYVSDEGYRYVDRSDLQMQLPLEVSKAVSPPSPFLVGEVVTYSLLAVVPPNSILYWPHHVDTLPRGVRYNGWYSVTGGELLSEPVTGTVNRRETLEWWWNSLDNSDNNDPFTLTFQFEAALTGIDTDGNMQWTDYDDQETIPNDSIIEWNTENISSTYSPWTLLEANRPSAADVVIQPYLVHPQLLPVKTLLGGGPVESGDLITYSFIISNVGLGPAFDVIISDTLPAGLIFHSYQAQVYPAETVIRLSYTPTATAEPARGQGGTIGWVFDEISEGDGNYRGSNTQLLITYTLEVTDRVGAGAELINSVWISDYSSLPGDQPHERHYGYLDDVGVRYSATSVFVPEAQIAKTADVTEVGVGETILFTITVPDPAMGATLYNVVVTDTVSIISPTQALQVIGADASGIVSLTVATGTVSAEYISIPARLQATILVTARVPVTAVGGLVLNEAIAAWEDAASDGNEHRATSDPVTVTIVAPDVAVTKNAPAAVYPGHSLLYTIAYENNGTGDAKDVRLTDTLPVSVTFAHSSTNRPVTPVVGLSDSLVWELGTLQAGESGTIWVTVTVWSTATLGSSLVNSVTIGTSSLGDDLANNQDTAATSVAGAVLEIAKTAVPDPVAAGGQVLYTLVVSNSGSQAAQNLVITDRLPLSTAFVAAGSGGTLVDRVVVWNAADLDIGAQTAVTFAVRVDSPLVSGTQIVNDAYGAAADNAPSTAFVPPVIVTVQDAGLAIDKSASPDPVAAGELVQYALTVSNVGEVEALGVLVTDRVPLNTTFDSANLGGLVGVDNVVRWTIGDLGMGEQRVVTFAVRVDSPLVSGTQIVNDAYGAVADNAPSTAPVSPVIVTVQNAQLAIDKSASPDPVAAGGLLRYTLTVDNLGYVGARGVVVTDRVPLSTTFDSASTGGSLGPGGVVNWTFADLGVGEQRVVTFAVRVDSPLRSGTQIVNDAYGVLADNAPSPSTVPVTVVVHSQAALFIQKAAATAVNAGDNLVYTLRYGNTGNAVANRVRITESYDSNVAFSEAVPSPSEGNNIWVVDSLTPGSVHTIVITVQVAEFVANGTRLTNTVTIDSQETGPLSDTVSTVVGGYLLYMPLLMKDYVPATGINLVVQSVQVEPDPPKVGEATRVTVTLHNSGSYAVSDDFWVDLYIDPSTTPTVNTLWNDIAPFGKAWLIRDGISGGGSLIIHTDQPDDPQNPEGRYSNWPGWFVGAGEHQLYVQVDSYDSFGLATGTVLEDDETDNVYGPASVTVVPGDTLLAPSPPVQWQERR